MKAFLRTQEEKERTAIIQAENHLIEAFIISFIIIVIIFIFIIIECLWYSTEKFDWFFVVTAAAAAAAAGGETRHRRT